MHTVTDTKNTRAAALMVTIFLVLVTAACLLYLIMSDGRNGSCIAEIYQNGRLIRSVPLDRIGEPYTFDVKGENGCVNRIEVRPGSIGIIWADCPDQLCVRQGFADSPTLPVTCLPNRLVIRLVPEDTGFTDAALDAVTY